MDTEPGSPELLDSLVRNGCQVLLPVVTPQGPLDWAAYTGVRSLRAGPWGLREPIGPLLGAEAIATAALVLVPALAVDWQGIRLGRGGGHYDRTLPLAAPGTRWWSSCVTTRSCPWCRHSRTTSRSLRL